jgi:hypothetical protein
MKPSMFLFVSPLAIVMAAGTSIVRADSTDATGARTTHPPGTGRLTFS